MKQLLKFHASWCIPCKTLTDRLNTIDHPNVLKIQNVNVDTKEGASLVKKYSVRSVPTMILLDDGGEPLQKISAIPSVHEIRQMLDCLN